MHDKWKRSAKKCIIVYRFFDMFRLKRRLSLFAVAALVLQHRAQPMAGVVVLALLPCEPLAI